MDTLPNEIVELILFKLSLKDIINTMGSDQTIHTMVTQNIKSFIRQWFKHNPNYVRIDDFPLIRHAIMKTLIKNFNLETINLIDSSYYLWDAPDARFEKIYPGSDRTSMHFYCKVDISQWGDVFSSDKYPMKKDSVPVRNDLLLYGSIIDLNMSVWNSPALYCHDEDCREAREKIMRQCGIRGKAGFIRSTLMGKRVKTEPQNPARRLLEEYINNPKKGKR